MDNFNLRGFLIENKLTSNSKQIKEGGYDSTEEIGDLYQAEIEQYLGLSGKNYRDNRDLFNKAADIYDAMYNADLMDSTDSNFIYNQVEKFIKTNMPELANQSGEVSEQEGSIPNDIVWTDEEEDTGSHGTFNQLDLDASELDYYEVEVLGYSTSTGKAYSGKTSGEYGEVDYDDIDGIKEMNPRETKHYIASLKKYEPEHYSKFTGNSRQVDEEKGLTKREKTLKEQVLKALK